MDEEAITLPFDKQLEEHVLGCAVFDPNCIGELVESGFKPKHFYFAGNAKFYEYIVDEWREDPKKVDPALIMPKLHEFGYTVQRFTEIVSAIPSAGNVLYYAERVKQLAVLRVAVKVGNNLRAASTLREPDDIREAIAKAEGMIGKLHESQVKLDSIHNMRDLLMAYFEEVEQRYHRSESGAGISGLPSGFSDLDAMTGGFQDSDLIIVAARPSVGKTAFALNIARNVSLSVDGVPGEPGMIFSLEMPAKKLAGRLVSSESRLDNRNLRGGLMVGDDWEKFTMAIGTLSDMNVVIDDGAGQTVDDIKAKARKIKRERGLRYIIVDYLGFIAASRKGMTNYDRVTENVRELKNLAREMNVPVIALCQLSRSVEQRSDKRPALSDLRESGEIEQTADVVMFLYREDYHDKKTEKKGVVEVIIEKQRDGPTGTVELVFSKKNGRFSDLYAGGRVLGENGEQQVAAAI